MLLHFDDVVGNPRTVEEISFRGNPHRARRGAYPYGGAVYLVDGDDALRPAGLLFEFPGSAEIQVSFSDWREVGGATVPFRAEIDDGDRVFDYRYSSIEMSSGTPLWFHQAVSAPELDEVKVYRLHRTLLAAHCLGDADLLAELSTKEVVSANNGAVGRSANDAVRRRFEALFERLDYSEYHDLSNPVIEISGSSDLGWIAAHVRAVGSDRETGMEFDDEWAWLMIVRKEDGHWRHAANASNVAR